MQQHSARTRLRSKHRVIPSMFLQNVITELEEAAVMSELQQTDRKNVPIPSHQAKNVKQTKISGDSDDDDDEDDEFNGLDEFGRTKNLDYRFTTQFDDAKKHTRDIFNKVRTAEKVIHNFVSASPNQYVYGQTLHGGGNNKSATKGRKLDLANASRRLDANKKALLSESGEVRFANIDDILRDEDLAEMEQSYDANQDDDDHEDDDEPGDENNENENDEEEQDDEVQRLLGDDWRNDEGQEDETGEDASENMNNKKRRQKSSLLPSQNKSSPSKNAAASIPALGSKRRRLPDLLDVANQVTRRNRAISLLQVSRAMSLQTDNKKAKTMIHFQGGSLLSQRRDIMELQNELQNQIEDGGNNLDSNFIRTGLVSSKCFTTSTDLRCTSREIMAEEYFNPSRNGVFAITTTTVASRRRQQRQQQRKGNNSNARDMKFGSGFGPVDGKNNDDEEDDDDDDEDEAEKQRSREEQNRISAKLDFLRAHKPEFLVEDSYRRIDAFIAAEDDNTVTSNLLERNNNNNNNNNKMLTPMDFLNNVSSTSPIISAPMYKSKFLQQRRAQQDAEYLLQMNNNAVKTDGDKSEKLVELSRSATTKKNLITSTSTGGFISQATVQQALQQSQMDEEHERHLILRKEQQLCRSIIESYRQFHVLSVQPYLDAERRSVTLAKECQCEIDSLEKKLRVGTHAKEEVTSASSESDDKKIGKKASTPITVGKVSFLTTSKNEKEKSANEKNDAESKNEKSSDAGNVNRENSLSSSSTITPFKITTAGYSILNSLGEQMDKLRAEDLEEKEERRKRQKMLEEAEDHIGVKNTGLGRHQSASSILLKKMMQDDTEHHQSIVFRTTNAASDHNNKNEREGDASADEAHDDDENATKDDPSRPPRRVKNTAMMEALRVAQNQQTALTLSKLPQLSAFVTLVDDDSNAENADDDDSSNLKQNDDLQSVRRSTRSNSLFPTQSPQKPAKKRKINPLLLKYCEYAERFVETQNKERAAFEEKVQTYRLATQQKQQQKRQNNFNNQQLQPQSSSSTTMPSSPLFFNANKIGSKNFSRDDQNNTRSEQDSLQRDISNTLDEPATAITSTIFDDQGNVVASVEQCARLTSPPSCLVASKRWAESHRMLPSNAGGKLRSDMTGKLLFSGPTGGVLPIISSSANNFTSECDNQTLHSSKMSSAGSSNVACYDIFYPRFVAFEEQNAREVRERNLMELQTRVSDISILSRDARLEAGKAKKGVVQCILQQMDLF